MNMRRNQPRLKPVSDARRRRDAGYQAARGAVWERSGGRCEAHADLTSCTGRCEQVHHIAGRGGVDPHRQGNLLGVCDPCHRWIEGHPQQAMERGWIRSRLGQVTP